MSSVSWRQNPLQEQSETKEKIGKFLFNFCRGYDKVLKDYNMVSSNSIKTLISSYLEKNIDEIINTIEGFKNNGINAQRLIKKTINYLEELLLDSLTENTKN